MLIKSCTNCQFHVIKEEERTMMSHCSKEKCWAQFSKCIAKKALSRFLEQETSKRESVRAQVARA
ncbi:MAG: hypothetical protein OEW45_17220 [Deltaproteobacteria bacterium]|jgi:hypothetical protein|nr:hypothetical protein [Deltaproteobacteria bacterium]